MVKRRLLTLLAVVLAVALGALSTISAPTVAQAATPTGKVNVTPGVNVTAQFSGTKLDKKRVVDLERSIDGITWSKLTSAKMSSKGKVTFKTQPAPGYSYRAVAKAFNYKSKGKKVTAAAVATEPAAVGWGLVFADDFDGSELSPAWDHRLTNSYDAVGRLCAAPQTHQAWVSGGTVKLRAVKVTDKALISAVTQNAKAVQAAQAGSKYTKAEAKVTSTKASYDKAKSKSAKKKAKKAYDKAVKARNKLVPGCPDGVFENAMIGTGAAGHGVLAGQSGILEARIKFPTRQGMHGSAWMQSAKGQEIDMVESYGKGRGITSVIHQNNKRYPASAPYVSKSATKKSSWWSSFHNYSVEWNAKEVIFRVDGAEVRKLKNKNMNDTDYYLVLSMLSSDWETYRQKSWKSGTMEVDWVRIWAR